MIGSGEASPSLEFAAEAVGRGIVDLGARLVTGGRGGVMAAASRGARTSRAYADGDIVAILPGEDPADANEWADIVLPSGLGLARNVLVVHAADVVVVLGGRAGTLSEIALAWQLGKPIVALDLGEGWSSSLAGSAIDERERPPILRAGSEAECKALLTDLLLS